MPVEDRGLGQGPLLGEWFVFGGVMFTVLTVLWLTLGPAA